MQVRKVTIILGIVIVFISLLITDSSVAGLFVQGSNKPEGVTLADTVASKISYQGRLADAEGTPLNGTYNLVFQLWDAVGGGNQVGSDIVRSNVSVNDGVFMAVLDVPQSTFDGQALWLRIQVNDQWLSPRQELLPVPYALSLKPGAIMSGTVSGPGMQIINSHSSGGHALSAINYSSNIWRPAIYGENKGGSAGVYGRSDGWHAIVGWQASSDPSFSGVYGRNVGAGTGVTGEASHGAGVWGTSTDSAGVYGGSENHFGVEGRSTASSGVKGRSDNGSGVEGTSENSYGVEGYGAKSSGVYGLTTSTDPGHAGVKGGNLGEGDGVAGTALLTDTAGVRGINVLGYGVYGSTYNGVGVYGISGQNIGVYGEGGDYGIYGVASGSYGVGVYGRGDSSAYAAVFDGMVELDILSITGGSDIAEPFDIQGADTPEPGMVVVIDPDRPGKLKIAEKAYDRRVAGIISGAGDIEPGMVMGQKGSIADGEYPVALTGRVYCWADAAYGAIQPGDLLTTSDTPGYAMVADNPSRTFGAVLGKAMTSLDTGQGLVLVLVTLQ